MPLDPGNNMKAAEDILQVVLQGHIVAAAETICTASSRDLSLDDLSKAIVEKFVKITLPSPSSSKSSRTKASKTKTSKTNDKVYLYATELMTLGLIWENFHDATREGDGERLIRIWKFLLLIFKAARRKNYSIEALNLQLQINYILSPRQAAQLMWSRCINTTNITGHNIPMDLHLEHLNRVLKCIMRNMGSNMTDDSVKLAAECIQVVHPICSKFEECTSKCVPNSNKHSAPSDQRDFELVVQCLKDQQVYSHIHARKNSSFKFSNNLLQQLKYKNLIPWLKHKVPDLMEQ